MKTFKTIAAIIAMTMFGTTTMSANTNIHNDNHHNGKAKKEMYIGHGNKVNNAVVHKGNNAVVNHHKDAYHGKKHINGGYHMDMNHPYHMAPAKVVVTPAPVVAHPTPVPPPPPHPVHHNAVVGAAVGTAVVATAIAAILAH